MDYISETRDVMVTEEEISVLLQGQGWYLCMEKRYNTRYAYAKKRQGKQVLSRYISTEKLIPYLSQEDVLKKITPRD